MQKKFYLQGSQYIGKFIFAKVIVYQMEFHIKTQTYLLFIWTHQDIHLLIIIMNVG